VRPGHVAVPRCRVPVVERGDRGDGHLGFGVDDRRFGLELPRDLHAGVTQNRACRIQRAGVAVGGEAGCGPIDELVGEVDGEVGVGVGGDPVGLDSADRARLRPGHLAGALLDDREPGAGLDGEVPSVCGEPVADLVGELASQGRDGQRAGRGWATGADGAGFALKGVDPYVIGRVEGRSHHLGVGLDN